MKTQQHQLTSFAKTLTLRACRPFWLAALLCCLAGQVLAATATLYSNDFESYTAAATSPADVSDADPTGVEWKVSDDAALLPTDAGAGVQVINWITNASGGANQSLLLHPSSEAQIMLRDARSGTSYQLDFWTYVVRQTTSDRNMYIILQGEGADNNGGDILAYLVNRATNSTVLRYYDGVGPAAPGWTSTTANQAPDRWQHHRVIINPNALTFTLYVDDMATPVVSDADLARPDSAVPARLIIRNEGNSADDGYFAIDDISFTVDGSITLATTFTDGFESYPARVGAEDDADPLGPWVTSEVDGVGDKKSRAAVKVQVVDSTVITPHSGTKCLKVEYGQRAGASIAWGVTPQSDVQITWWSYVPQSVLGQQALYLRMSLYGVENFDSMSGDAALLGYGSRVAGSGDETSLLIYPPTGWLDSTIDYTPNTWEEYRLITHTAINAYTLIKSPSSANPQVIVDRGRLGGNTTPIPTNTYPMFMAAWSSSNGTNHPAAYIDDIEIKSLASNVDPLGEPYTVAFHGNRFTNYTILSANAAVGKPVVDPRDGTTILYAVDATPGGIYRAVKVGPGNWSVDPTPIVGGLDRPSGLAIQPDGTLWWTHDYNNDFTRAVARLKWPWTNNSVETIIADVGDPAATERDDDPIDLTIAPASFSGTIGQPGMVVVADRGVNGNANNGIYLIDPATTSLDQTNYNNFLVNPTVSDLGADMTQIASLPDSGEVATLSTDGYLVAIDGSGTLRYINALNLWPLGATDVNGTGIAVDPTTGKIWAADDLKDEIWSIDSGTGADQREIGFPLTDPVRTDRQIDMHDPSLAFAPNGSFMVVTDTSAANGGGGRLIVFHNEAFGLPAFRITSITRSGPGYQLTWESAGTAKYRVQRGSTPSNLQDITGDLTMTQFTDTNTVGSMFYRVVARP